MNKLQTKTVTLPDGTMETVTRGSGNIFADMETKNPEERLAKARLVGQIQDILDARGLTQSEAARLCGMKQPNLSALLRGRTSGYTVEKLLAIINALGYRVEIRVSKRAVAAERAVTVVV